MPRRFYVRVATSLISLMNYGAEMALMNGLRFFESKVEEIYIKRNRRPEDARQQSVMS